MKTAIYIEDGVMQLVLTPTTPHEKDCLTAFEGKNIESQIFTGSFYDCRGGWVRQSHHAGNSMYPSKEDKSLIVRVKTEASDKKERL